MSHQKFLKKPRTEPKPKLGAFGPSNKKEGKQDDKNRKEVTRRHSDAHTETQQLRL